jgi:hypothetical protein
MNLFLKIEKKLLKVTKNILQFYEQNMNNILVNDFLHLKMKLLKIGTKYDLIILCSENSSIIDVMTGLRLVGEDVSLKNEALISIEI